MVDIDQLKRFDRKCDHSAGDLIEDAYKELEALRAYAFEATKALTGLTVGGSEFFKNQGVLSFYPADIDACVANVGWRMERRAEFAARKAQHKVNTNTEEAD